jgi:hypothetical protein
MKLEFLTCIILLQVLSVKISYGQQGMTSEEIIYDWPSWIIQDLRIPTALRSQSILLSPQILKNMFFL